MFPTVIRALSVGCLKTLEIFFLTLAGSLPLGLVICFGSVSRFRPLRMITRFVIWVVRGTPLMLQLLVVYFGPYYLFGANIGAYRYPAIVFGFVINYAAYFAEIFRSGIQSMPQGQYEAADVLGYTKSQTFIKIILPQVIKRVLPPVTNETITLVKDTSLAYALTYAEMFTLAKQIAAAERSFIPLFVAGVFYYVFNYIVAEIMNQLEKKLNYYK